jgi:hypothetical protein
LLYFMSLSQLLFLMQDYFILVLGDFNFENQGENNFEDYNNSSQVLQFATRILLA